MLIIPRWDCNYESNWGRGQEGRHRHLQSTESQARTQYCSVLSVHASDTALVHAEQKLFSCGWVSRLHKTRTKEELVFSDFIRLKQSVDPSNAVLDVYPVRGRRLKHLDWPSIT